MEYFFLQKIREQTPLIHCITNIVVANFQANGLLALGASPVMADSIEEVEEMASIADCCVLNIGTIQRDSVEAMILAGKSANHHGVPVVLDPVGAGATTFRKETVIRLLKEVHITAIRCNAGELAAILGVEWKARGVDAGEGSGDIQQMAKDVANKYKCLVAVTGKTDVLTDGTVVEEIYGGHPLMTKVTGVGCLLSAVLGAFLAVGKHDEFKAATEALSFYKQVGEHSALKATRPGQFAVYFLDELSRKKEELK